MTTQQTTQQARRLLSRARNVAQRNLRRVVDEPRRQQAGRPRLAPTTALRENGFAVFRGMFPAAECAQLAAALKAEAGIRPGAKFTKVDAFNHYATAREILLEGRIIDAVRAALGEAPRFLQVGDLHYLHDTAAWHRDSVHRAHDASAAPDWRDSDHPFGVVKAILYLESENAAMGIMAGSHASPIEMDYDHVQRIESAGGQLVIDAGTDPNQQLSDADKTRPLAWRALVGDVLVFDERMYHAGRRVDGAAVSPNLAAPKFTLSMVFGRDNHHSERMYSYFRYARKELHYRDLPNPLLAELAERDLVLSRGWRNFYLDEPQELRHVHLPDPAKMEPLIAEFAVG